MRIFAFAMLAAAGAPLIVGCTSIAEEIHQKCASAANPAACEKAEYQKIRDDDDKRRDENAMKSGGGGY